MGWALCWKYLLTIVGLLGLQLVNCQPISGPFQQNRSFSLTLSLIALIFFRAIRYSVEKTEKTLRDLRLSLAQDFPLLAPLILRDLSNSRSETLNLTAKIHVLREEISLREF